MEEIVTILVAYVLAPILLLRFVLIPLVCRSLGLRSPFDRDNEIQVEEKPSRPKKQAVLPNYSAAECYRLRMVVLSDTHPDRKKISQEAFRLLTELALHLLEREPFEGEFPKEVLTYVEWAKINVILDPQYRESVQRMKEHVMKCEAEPEYRDRCSRL